MFTVESFVIGAIVLGILGTIAVVGAYCIKSSLERTVRCEHGSKTCGRVTVDESRGITSEIRIVPCQIDDELQWCLGCLAKMTAACGVCKQPIVVGDRVGLYAPTKQSGTAHVPPKVATFGSHPTQWVCHYDCCDSDSPTGYWVPGRDGTGQFHPARSIARLQKAGWQVALNDGSHRLLLSQPRTRRSAAA